MLMDRRLQKLSGVVLINGLRYRYSDNHNHFTDPNPMMNGFRVQAASQSLLDHNNYISFQQYMPPLAPVETPAPAPPAQPPILLPARPLGDSVEDAEVYSDIAVNYISRMLMEEDIDEKVSLYQEESAALWAAEKPFYDILGQEYPPPSPNHPPLSNYTSESSNSNSNSHGHTSHQPKSSSNNNGLAGDKWASDQPRQIYPASHVGGRVNSRVEHLSRAKSLPDTQLEDEKDKFLSSYDRLMMNLEINESTPLRQQQQKSGKMNSSRGRKNSSCEEELDVTEGRSNKQSAILSEDILRSEMFDSVLLCYEGKCRDLDALRVSLHKEATKNYLIPQSKGQNGAKARGKRQSKKKEVVDLRTLLIHCAQAVAADNRMSANDLLKQIRQHSSPFGDGSQRLAHCFADGLEARLAGTGSQIYNSLTAKRTVASDILKAYHLFLAACPFKRISHFVSNLTIVNVSEKASTVHIVDFGIYFGFQWPALIQRLASRPGGPPKLRITGIDVPQPGFRPTERIEETGRRLADYAQSFGVPFEYHPIASKWEAIRVEDLKIEKGEVLVVNCLYRFRNLVDETVVVDSPRNKVLNTIREMNPNVFIHGIINGSYSAPFFVTRFREALFHYSALFDMLETNVPREDAERLLIERDLFGREALNVIACEGSERVERPETYKQWQVRNLRAGFEQVQLKPDLMKKAKERVKNSYHKDFVIDEDSCWLLQGWKGRIIYALSTWKPRRAL